MPPLLPLPLPMQPLPLYWPKKQNSPKRNRLRNKFVLRTSL
jgi:hypothetical protein